MLIAITITPTAETEHKLFQSPWALSNFRSAVVRTTDQLEEEIKRIAPKATGEYRASIDSTAREYGDPYRWVCRAYSVHNSADVIEFGAEPHTVPIRSIMRWMQAVGMRIANNLTPEQVAYKIQHKIEERGLRPHYVFTQAYDFADGMYHDAIDPILAALGGSAEYDVELRSSGSRELSW